MPEVKPNKLTADQQQMIDECIEKYMQSLKIVQKAIHDNNSADTANND